MLSAKRLLGTVMVGVMACTPALAEHYIAIGQWDNPFTSEKTMRLEGHSVHVLYSDSTAKVAVTLNKQLRSKPDRTDAELDELLDKFESQVDKDILEKAVRTDMAVQLLVKNLQLRKLPAVMLRRDGKLFAVYGETDLRAAAQKLDMEIQ